MFVGPEHCETADTIRQSACGSTIRLGESAQLLATIEALASDPSEGSSMGQRGRSAFLAEFEREGCCAHWSWMLGQMVGSPAAVPALPAVILPARSPRRLAVPSPTRMRRAFLIRGGLVRADRRKRQMTDDR